MSAYQQGLIGGPLIPGRAGRKKCAQSRQAVKQFRRANRSKGAKPSLRGSEKPQPKPGVYWSAAPASGSVAAKGYKPPAKPFDLDTWLSRARLRVKRGGKPLVKVMPQ